MKKKFLLISLSLGLLFSALFINSCKDPALAGDNTKIYLVGKIIDSITHAGISGLTVKVRSGKDFVSATTKEDNADTTDITETGDFEFEDVIASGDMLELRVYDADGTYATYVDTINTYDADGEPYREMELADIEVVTADGTLSGVVYGISGAVADITVYCRNITDPAAGNYYQSTTSGSDGTFSFTSVPKANSYSCFTAPTSAYNSTTVNFIDLGHFANPAEATTVTIVLPSATGDFDLVWSNIYESATTGVAGDYFYAGHEVPLFSTTDQSLYFYYNKNVVDDASLVVNCMDTYAGVAGAGGTAVVPVTTTVSNTQVTVAPKSAWVYGRTYNCDITARAANSESVSYDNLAFMVITDTSPAAVTDLAFDETDTGSTFQVLLDAAGTMTAHFDFTFISDATYYSVHLKNTDPDEVYSVFDLSANVGAQVAGSITWTAPALVAGNTIDLAEINQFASTDTTGSFSLNLGSFTDTIASSQAVTFYIMVLACNFDQIGYDMIDAILDPDTTATIPNSDDCTMSNIVTLSATKT